MRFVVLFAGLVLLSQMAAAAPPLSFTPAEGEVVHDPRPVITVNLPADGSVDPGLVRMWVNGREVTGLCLKTPSWVSYRPPVAMEAGPVEVRFATPGPREVQFRFQVQPTARIQAVTHNGSVQELSEYDELEVTMRAESGGEAWFEVPGFKEGLPMLEVEEGLYKGKYLVQPGDYKLGGPVVGHLRLGPHLEQLASREPVKIFGHIFRVKILEPANGSQVPLQFTIKGRTRPNARITVVPKIGFDASMRAPSTGNLEGGEGGAIDGKADEKGFFSIDYGVPLKLPNIRVVMAVFAVTEDGERSAPVILHYRF
ncbi:MAG: hypothetical protein HY319_05710 [Armatimonadetes bacterium]|nr:hypothetical protein [Armatimonadota bacterium]